MKSFNLINFASSFNSMNIAMIKAATYKSLVKWLNVTISYFQHDSLSHQSWWFREILSSLDRRRLARSSTLDQSIISLELLLDVLWWRTFAEEDCRVDWDQFNDSKISEKYEDLTQQMSSKILRVETARSFSCQHLSSLELISARWLSYILWKT